MRHLPVACVFFIKQTALGNPKTSIQCAHWNCFILEIKRYYMCAIQSRDAKSCVSQARMRNEPVRIYVCRCSDFTRETQNFASLLGWRQHIFSTKQAALGNMKASFHCSHWHCFCIMKNTHLNRKSTFRQSTQTLQHNHHRLDKNECRESGYS